MPIFYHHKNKDLKRSYFSGIWGCVMTGLTQDYFVPFLLVIGGSAFHVGLLNCFNNLFSSLGQILSADLTVKLNSRKRLIILFFILQVLSLLILGILTYTARINISVVIILIVAFTSLGALTHPCWISLLSDMVSNNKRGEYFGWRARNLGYLTLIATFVAGTILFIIEQYNVLSGFIIIFLMASLSRFVSFLYVKRLQEPHLAYKREDIFSFWDFIKGYKKSNFVKFTIFAAGINFSVNIAAPYFAIFMLHNLSFNYMLYTLINIAAPITLYSVIHRWGNHADQVGNLKILKIVGPSLGLIPLLWIINQHPFFLISSEIIAGFLWAGFNLCSSNFIIDAVKPEKRTRCIAYFSVINGVALAAGALVGGLILKILPPLFGHKILTLFAISACLRITSGIILSRDLQEVRPVERVNSQQILFSMIGVKPIAGIERKSIQI